MQLKDSKTSQYIRCYVIEWLEQLNQEKKIEKTHQTIQFVENLAEQFTCLYTYGISFAGISSFLTLTPLLMT